MQIITVSSTKGGTGKSTISTHFCSYLQKYHQENKNTILIDADLQSSSSDWLSSSPLRLNKVVKVANDEEINQILTEAESNPKIHYCVIDCPAGLPETTRTAILLSSMVVIPTQPHLMDLRSLNKTLGYLGQVWKVRQNLPPAYIILNRCRDRSNLKKEAEWYLEDLPANQNISYVPYPIHNRLAIADAPNQNNFVFDLEDDKAHQELYNVCAYLYNQLRK